MRIDKPFAGLSSASAIWRRACSARVLHASSQEKPISVACGCMLSVGQSSTFAVRVQVWIKPGAAPLRGGDLDLGRRDRVVVRILCSEVEKPKRVGRVAGPQNHGPAMPRVLMRHRWLCAHETSPSIIPRWHSRKGTQLLHQCNFWSSGQAPNMFADIVLTK
jgi:hypothetical protein